MNRVLAFFLCILVGASAASGSGQTSDQPRVELRTTLGRIVVELDPDSAPLNVANFLGYVDSGFYDGTIFHRVIPNFMIQAGGMTPDLEEKPTGEPVRNESRNHLHNERGTIAMARTDDPNSATSQFYINVRSNLRLDFDYVTRRPGYTVFGRVIEGMDVVDAIALVETAPNGRLQDVPVEPVLIESARRL